MTIKALKEYLKKKYPHLFRKTNIYTFHKCKIVIDASDLAYKYWAPMQETVIEQLKDPTEELDLSKVQGLWLRNIWSFISKLLRLGITPVIVFDGKPPVEKDKVIKERQKEKYSARAEIDKYLTQIR